MIIYDNNILILLLSGKTLIYIYIYIIQYLMLLSIILCAYYQYFNYINQFIVHNIDESKHNMIAKSKRKL